MATMNNPFEGKHAKFVQRKGERVGHIELRNLKSKRNTEIALKKKAMAKKIKSISGDSWRKEDEQAHNLLHKHLKRGPLKAEDF